MESLQGMAHDGSKGRCGKLTTTATVLRLVDEDADGKNRRIGGRNPMNEAVTSPA